MTVPLSAANSSHSAVVARLHLRVLLGSASTAAAAAMGPGKADFLAAVGEVGSVAGAGRILGLSYKKTRHLLDALNSAFHGPVVETRLGGRDCGGACLTPLGVEVLACYRAIERQAAAAVAADLNRLAALSRMPDSTAILPASTDLARSSPKPPRVQRSKV